jgi:hypothetical protein
MVPSICKDSQVRIVTADGTVVVERRIATRADQFATVFGGCDRSWPIRTSPRCMDPGRAGSRRIAGMWRPFLAARESRTRHRPPRPRFPYAGDIDRHDERE